MRTQQEDGNLQVEKRGLTKNQINQQLDFRLLSPPNYEKLISVVEATQSMIFGFSSLR